MTRGRLGDARRVVVKVGTSSVSDGRGRLDRRKVGRIVDEVAAALGMGREVVLVSSGAIAAGLAPLGFTRRPLDLPTLQACAAVGQSHLMDAYATAFHDRGHVCAQILLTRHDVTHRQQYVNALNTFRRLLALGAVPIVNENDTVATDEIGFGENDLLAALVANLVRADALLLLSDVDGLHEVLSEGGLTQGRSGSGGEKAPPDAPPESQIAGSGREKAPPDSPPKGARPAQKRALRLGPLISEVQEITPQVEALALGKGSALSSGGMRTKLDAARIATRSGVAAVIARLRPGVLERILTGRPVGTFFRPQPSRLTSRKAWIAFATVPRGTLVVDAGARDAVVRGKRSLLVAGIRAIEGTFGPGDAVDVADHLRDVFARGLVSFSSDELEGLLSRTGEDGRAARAEARFPREAIHRDELVVL